MKNESNNNKRKNITRNTKAGNKGAKKAKPATPKTTKDKAQNVKKLSIYEKIFNVQQNVAPVMKTAPGEGDGYAYTRERDIIAEVKPMLKAQRLTYVFTTKNRTDEDPKRRKLTIEFKLINVDNPTEYILTDMAGEGISKEDSATGIAAAYTMALKYYFSKMFMVEIEDSLDQTKGKGKEKKPDAATEYEKSKKLIESTRNVDGLIEFQEQVKTGKFFNKEQREDLEKRITARIAELQHA